MSDSSSGDPAAVDDEEVANDEARLFGAQEQHGLSQLFGLAHPPDGKQLPGLLRLMCSFSIH